MPRPSFIGGLIADLTPVQATRFRHFLALWLSSSLAIAILFLFLVELRQDLSFKLTNPSFVLGLMILLGLYVVASYVAIALALPGRQAPRQPYPVLAIVIALYGGGVMARMSLASAFEARPFLSSNLSQAFWCSARIGFGASLIGMVFLFLLLRRTTFNMRWSIAFGLCASTVLVALVSHLHCPIDDLWHLVVGHLLGVAAPMAVAYGLFFSLAAAIEPRRT